MEREELGARRCYFRNGALQINRLVQGFFVRVLKPFFQGKGIVRNGNPVFGKPQALAFRYVRTNGGFNAGR